MIIAEEIRVKVRQDIRMRRRGRRRKRWNIWILMMTSMRKRYSHLSYTQSLQDQSVQFESPASLSFKDFVCK